MMSQPNNTRVGVPNSHLSDNTTASDEANDATPPNPSSGRGVADSGITERKPLLKCKKVITAATFNARTIRETARKEELLHSMSEQSIDILGVQEHRIIHDDPLKYEKVPGYTIITASAWRNDMMAATGGVGIVISNKAMKSLSGVTVRGNRNLIVNFTGNPKTSIIVTYSPTNASSKDEIDKYYDDLRGCIDSIPTHNFLMLLGNFNARLGKEDARHTMHLSTNRNGNYLVDLIMEKDLIVTNTYFKKHDGKLWTFLGPGGYKAQIDYIITRRKWRNPVLNCEAYSTFTNVGSDHRVVSARIRLSLKANCKSPPKRVIYKWNEFSRDKDLQESSIEVRNRFSALTEDSQTDTSISSK